MNVGCIPICFFEEIRAGRMTLDQWHEMAAGLGLEGVEIYEGHLDNRERRYLKSVSAGVRVNGLRISMFTGYCDLAHPNPQEWERQVEHVRQNVESALILGAKVVRIVAGSWRVGTTRDTLINNVVRALRECIPYARERGVELAFEDHPQIGTKIEDFVEIIKRATGTGVKVNLDTSNPLLDGDDPVKLAEMVKDRVIHVHVSDRHENLDHAVIGEGVVDFPAIFRILKSAGYDGWLSLVVGGMRGADGIRASIEYVRKTWDNA